MATAATIDSNVSELAYAEESSFKTLPATPTWYPAEPNSYGDMGGDITTVAREPISSDRQRRKPVVVDLDGKVEYEQDVTQNNLSDLMQGFVFASYRKKAEFETTLKTTGISSVTAATKTFTMASGGTNFTAGHKIKTSGFTNSGNNGVFTVVSSTATTVVVSEVVIEEASPPAAAQIASAIGAVTSGSSTFTLTKDGTNFRAGDLIQTSGFTNAANNGLFRVASSTATTVVITGATLTTETTVPDAAKMVVVGFQFASGDVTITQGTDVLPYLTATAKDLTQLGLVPGEWVFIGDGSAAAYSFATTANNGYARVRSVTATTITFDKTYSAMVTDAGSSKTIRLYVGRVLKNETGSSVVRRTYNFERKLGAPDTGSPSQIQSEYVVGATPSEVEISMPKTAKITANLKYMGGDHETRSAATGIKSGTRATLVAEDAFNTSSDVSYIKLATTSNTNSCPDALFGYISDLTLMINNNVSGNKAIGELGSFDMNAGSFDVSAKLTAYFANVSVTSTLRNGTSLTLDCHLVKNNSGISFDIPQIVSSKNLNKVERNKPIEVPLETDASSAVEVDSTLNHTILMIFFDYLPSAADV